VTPSYAYALDVVREDGTPVSQVPIDVDWEPARDCLRFVAVRRGLASSDAFERECVVEPLWHAEKGEPYLGGFRVRMTYDGLREVSQDFPTNLLRGLTRRVSEQLVAEGALREGDTFRCDPIAFAQTTAPRAASRKIGVVARATPPAIALCEGSLEDFLERAVPPSDVDRGDMPVFLPQGILAEVARLTDEAGLKETGGVVIGHLHRDTTAAEVFAEITAQIPAIHTDAELTRLTFTPATWTSVRAALALRARGEIMLGWWHSHPVREWCKDCPLERQRDCIFASGFLSEHDRALHRTMFPRAFSIALVVNDVATGGPTYSLFGWRLGLLERRGFHTLEAPSTVVTRGLLQRSNRNITEGACDHVS